MGQDDLDASGPPIGVGQHAAANVPSTLSEADFDALVRTRWRQLVQLSVLLIGEQAAAEDVVQDAFASLYSHWRDMRSLSGAAAYARTSVVNGSRSALRRRRVADRALTHLRGGNESPADTAVLAAERQREVLDALHSLPRRQREVIVLRYWSDLSEAEIAATLSISRGSVKSSAARGIAKLSSALGGGK